MMPQTMADARGHAVRGAPRRPRSRARDAWASAPWALPLVWALVAALGFRVVEFVPAIAVVKPVLLLTGAAVLLFMYASGGEVLVRPLRHTSGRLVLSFYGWMLLCVPTSLWRGASLGVVKGMTLTLAAAWIIMALPANARVADRLQRIFVFAALLFAGLVLALGGETVEGRFGARIGLDVNDIALVAAVSVPLAIGLALRASALGKVLYWTGAAVLIVTVMRTGSRGGGLALLATVPVLLTGLPLRRSLQLLALGVPLAIGSWVAAPESFRERMTSLLAGEQDYNRTDADGRIAIWKRGLSYGVEHPVLGVGPGAFFVQDGVGKAERGLSGKWSVAHNIFVQAFAEMGFPGILLLAGMLVHTGGLALRAHRGRPGFSATKRPELLAALAGFVVGAFFLSFLFYPITWLLLGGIVTMSQGSLGMDAMKGGTTAGERGGRQGSRRRAVVSAPPPLVSSA